MTLFMVAALFVKHFLLDFILQGPYQWSNKGVYGSPGGLLHAWLASLGTFIVLTLFPIPLLAILACMGVEFVVHYHLDWLKVNVCNVGKITPNHVEFWWIFGFHQLLFQIGYIVMVAFLLK